MHRIIFLLLFATSFDALFAQPLSTPPDVSKAYKKGTRSTDGRPGKNYWQNHARYHIRLSAAPPLRTINGSEEITYFNESPDALKRLVFKFIVNIHKPGAPRMGGAKAGYLTSGIHIDSLVVNGKARPWKESESSFTVVPLKLDKALSPNDSIRLFIKWHYDVSLISNREGMIDSTTYFLAYSYPRIAVYDDYQGWDEIPFEEGLEFYSDFNDYDVQVTVPKNYVVWGTGTLLNPDEVLQPEFADRFQRSLASDEVIHVATSHDLASGIVTAAGPTNTWHFSAHHIPDVALGLSDHFVWDATSVLVDGQSGRRASVQAAYNDTASDYHHMAHLAREAVSWLSFKWPGIPYPYEKTTIFQGYAGMEYPMMANDETYGDTTFARFVAQHEIAHTYMPFYMGINETRYGFMDEGWATTFELLFNRDMMEREKADNFYKQFRVTNWAHDRSPGQDLPIVTPGYELSGPGLGNNEYGKASLGYLAVKDLLGDDVFRKSLHEYMSRWNGRHPLPWDFFYTFNDASGKDLNWFWNNWFFSHNHINLAIKSVKNSGEDYSVTVQNIGGMAAPFDLVFGYSDGTTFRSHFTPSLWEENQKETTIKVKSSKEIQTMRIDGGIFMDADESNNSWKK